MFLNGSVEDKRFITQTVLSNATYYDGNFDVELHPAFDTLFRLAKESNHQNSTIELPESSSGQQKRASKKALDLNGGVDAHRFELYKKYYEHLNDTPVTRKICYLISSLKMIA